jgi:hypothetical protein
MYKQKVLYKDSFRYTCHELIRCTQALNYTLYLAINEDCLVSGCLLSLVYLNLHCVL